MNLLNMVARGGIGLVRIRHRHEDFQTDWPTNRIVNSHEYYTLAEIVEWLMTEMSRFTPARLALFQW